jgi:hypothetical protein
LTDVARYIQLFVPMLWLGMVVAISFVEAPLKFRAPGVTVALGLGIGRVVFRALNIIECILAAVLVVAALRVEPTTAGWALVVATVATLAIQIVVVRPPLTKRSNRVLAGEELPRSRLHLVYIGCEFVKVVLLVAMAIALTHGLGTI